MTNKEGITIKVYKLSIPDEIIEGIIKEIKSNRKLLNLDNDLISDEISKYLKNEKKATEKLSEAKTYNEIKRSKEVEAIVKHVRSYFYKNYTSFQTVKNTDKVNLLNELKERIDLVGIQGTVEMHRKILMTHISTKERIDIYDHLYKDLFEITGKPNKIIDISCGLNPISFPYMDLDNVTYVATELNELDLKFIEKYFQIIEKHANIAHRTIKLDLSKSTASLEEKGDVCFMFKIIDLFDNKVMEKIIKKIGCKWVIISVSTQTIAKNEMMFKRRAGFQKMLRRLDLKYKTKEYENELFYIIEKEI